MQNQSVAALERELPFQMARPGLVPDRAGFLLRRIRPEFMAARAGANAVRAGDNPARPDQLCGAYVEGLPA